MEGRTSSPRLDGIHIVLILAAVFAIGSVGFFLAILLGHAYAPSPAALQQQQKALTPEQKISVAADLYSGASSSSASTASTSSGVQHSPVPADQADPNDAHAAQKIDAANSLYSN